MKFLKTEHPDVVLVEPQIYKDSRGFFMETYQQAHFSQAGIPYDFVQDNHSSSVFSTLRGLHYQISHPQGKLVRVVIGEIFDVAVDLRKSSPNFGKWVGVLLSQENKLSLWVPPGFAHGFYTCSERADIIYKATDFFDPAGERCIRWDDPDLAINWPIDEGVSPIVSEKDTNGVRFLEAEVFE